MDRQEARVAAQEVLARLRVQTYQELAPLADASRWVDVQGASGAWYAVKVQALLDEGHEGGPLRVCASAMTGHKGRFGWLQSEEADFIIGPDGAIDG